MRLEQLNLFLTTLNSGSFAAAGRLLHMSQPSITAALNSLEEEVGTRLIERSPGQRKPVMATEAGMIFADYARKALADYRAMLSTVTLSTGTMQMPVRIGVTSTPSSTVLPVLTNKFREENPSASVHVRTYSGAELMGRLMRGEFEIAVTGTRPVQTGVIFDRFFYDPLVLIAPVSMKLPEAITLRELKKLPLIMRDPSGHLMRLLIQGLHRVGLSLEQMNVVMQVSGNNDVLTSVALGAGVGFVARSLMAATRQSPDITVIPVRRLQVDRYIYQIRRENAPYIGTLRLFWEYALSPEWREGVFSFNTMRL